MSIRGPSPAKPFGKLFFPSPAPPPISNGIKTTTLSVVPTAEQLLRKVAAVIDRETEVIEDQLWRNDIELIQGEASFQNPHTLIVALEEGARTVTADRILIAVGTTPAPPPGVSIDGDVIITSDDIVQLKRIPQRMAVIGGGVIGIEYASMFAALKLDVTVIDKREHLLTFLDEEIVEELVHQMRNRDVTFRLGEAVERLEIAEGPPRQAVIHLESGKRIVSDLVLFSAGRTGSTDHLNVTAAGLTASERGLLTVDNQFRTEVPHILPPVMSSDIPVLQRRRQNKEDWLRNSRSG